MIKTISIPAQGKGLHDVTELIQNTVRHFSVDEGLATLFIQHTSASLIVQENADPAVIRDLENWLEKTAPESPNYEHQEEGPDDMPAHIKGAITPTQISIPVIDGKLALGTWQGIFLWEHRTQSRERNVVVHIQG